MKETIHFASRGQSGNIYYILGAIRDVLRKQNRIAEWNELYEEVNRFATSYIDALEILRKHVNLIDDDGLY